MLHSNTKGDSEVNFLRDIKAFCFDVFGTVIDWRSSVATSLETSFGNEIKGVDWVDLVVDWRREYMSLLQKLASNDSQPEDVDVLHRRVLDSLLSSSKWKALGDKLDETQRVNANLFWHKISDWPDSSAALYTLKKHAMTGTLANGTLRIFVDIAKYADLPWDFVLTGQLLGAYKPAPSVYLSALSQLSLKPSECVMVAAHAYDVRAAAKLGFHTVYVRRQTEDNEIEGGVSVRDAVKTKREGGEVDLVVESLKELASIVELSKA